MYDCSTEECTYLSEAYKVEGNLPKYSNFEVGRRYQYQCHACEGNCVVEVEEGEKIDLHQSLFGLSFEFLSSQAPLASDGTWQTEHEDAGVYTTTIKLLDEHEDDTASFCLLVKDENRAPIIVSVSNAGEDSVVVQREVQDAIGVGEQISNSIADAKEENSKLAYLILIVLFVITVFRVRALKKRRKKHKHMDWKI